MKSEIQHHKITLNVALVVVDMHSCAHQIINYLWGIVSAIVHHKMVFLFFSSLGYILGYVHKICLLMDKGPRCPQAPIRKKGCVIVCST